MTDNETYLRHCDRGLRAFHRDRGNARHSPDSAWPLRAADGRTWAEHKEPKL